MDALGPRSRLALLLDHFATVRDTRQAWKVAYPLREVMFLVVCGTIADNDDYENIAAWGQAHLAFLRRFSAFHHGIPCPDWLSVIMNRVDPDLFSACFSAWVAECWPDKPTTSDRIGGFASASSGKSENRSEIRRTLIKPDEIIQDTRSDEAFVIVRGAKPLRCGRAVSFRRPEWAALVEANRFHKGKAA